MITSSPSTFSASSGSRAASESRAEVVWAKERISIQWPSNMMTTNSASSHQNSNSESSSCRLAPSDAMKATLIARLMSSIIPGLRARTSEIPPVRKGEPPQRYMTVPSKGETHNTQAASGN